MIRGRFETASGRHVLLFGLTGESITRLLADEPVKVDLAELGLTGVDLVLMYGKTDQDIIDRVQGYHDEHSRPDTRVKVVDRRHDRRPPT